MGNQFQLCSCETKDIGEDFHIFPQSKKMPVELKKSFSRIEEDDNTTPSNNKPLNKSNYTFSFKTFERMTEENIQSSREMTSSLEAFLQINNLIDTSWETIDISFLFEKSAIESIEGDEQILSGDIFLSENELPQTIEYGTEYYCVLKKEGIDFYVSKFNYQIKLNPDMTLFINNVRKILMFDHHIKTNQTACRYDTETSTNDGKQLYCISIFLRNSNNVYILYSDLKSMISYWMRLFAILLGLNPCPV